MVLSWESSFYPHTDFKKKRQKAETSCWENCKVVVCTRARERETERGIRYVHVHRCRHLIGGLPLQLCFIAIIQMVLNTLWGCMYFTHKHIHTLYLFSFFNPFSTFCCESLSTETPPLFPSLPPPCGIGFLSDLPTPTSVHFLSFFYCTPHHNSSSP